MKLYQKILGGIVILTILGFAGCGVYVLYMVKVLGGFND